MKKLIFILVFVVLGFVAKSKAVQVRLDDSDIIITTSCGSVHKVSNKKFDTVEELIGHVLELYESNCG